MSRDFNPVSKIFVEKINGKPASASEYRDALGSLGLPSIIRGWSCGGSILDHDTKTGVPAAFVETSMFHGGRRTSCSLGPDPWNK